MEEKLCSFLPVPFQSKMNQEINSGMAAGWWAVLFLWSAKITNNQSKKYLNTKTEHCLCSTCSEWTYDMWCALNDFAIGYRVLGHD